MDELVVKDLIDRLIDLSFAEDIGDGALELAEEFTSADFAKLVKIPRQLAGTVLLVLWQLGLVERVGKVGNRYLYRVAANASDTKDSASS